MNVYTYSEARQHLAELLDKAKNLGKILIRRKDGSLFALTPEKKRSRSPLDVKGITTNISTHEMIQFIRESRKR